MGKAHVNALQTAPYIWWPSTPKTRLIAIVGRRREAAREAAIRYGAEFWTTDWRSAIAHPDVDVFDNVAPDDCHVKPTLEAIAAGKHVICEKPLALTADDAVALAEAADMAGVKHLTCFNYRFLPAVRLAWEMVHNGDLGELHHVRFRYAQEWRLEPAAIPGPAGALAIIGCHAIDQARFLVGEINRVMAVHSSPATKPGATWHGVVLDPIDTVTFLAEFSNGVTGSIDASLVSVGRKQLLA